MLVCVGGTLKISNSLSIQMHDFVSMSDIMKICQVSFSTFSITCGGEEEDDDKTVFLITGSRLTLYLRKEIIYTFFECTK